MSYRLNKIHAGVFCSLVDIITSPGQKLEVPRGFADEGAIVTNVMPVLNRLEILEFLQKNAPTMLELSCGIGMRRVLGFHPQNLGCIPSSQASGNW